MRQEIMALVRGIAPCNALEQAHQAETLAWLASGAPFCRVAKPATPPMHLVSYVVLVDPAARKMLLVAHRNAGLWLPGGGHVEPGEHPADTAARELHEEFGLAASFLAPTPLFLTVTTTVGSTAGHTDVSLWYVLRADADLPIDFDPAEFHDAAWFSYHALPLGQSDPHMGRFIGKLLASSLS